MAEMTGLGTSTVCGIVSDVTKAIINNLWNEQVDQHFPRDKQQFREKKFGYGRNVAVFL